MRESAECMEKIGVGYAYVSDKEKKYVNEALDAGRLSQGEMVHRFEKEFARLHDQKYGIACIPAAGKDKAKALRKIKPANAFSVPGFSQY